MITGNDLRKKFNEELKSEGAVSKLINRSNDLDLKNLKESFAEIKIDEIDKTRFSLYNPISALEKNYLSAATFTSLKISNELPIKIIELSSSIHLNLFVENNSSCNLIFLMKDESQALFVEAHLSEHANAKITCISPRGELLTRYHARCESNSNLDIKTLSLSSINSESKLILEDNASGKIINSILNKEELSKSNDVMVHRGSNTNSQILSKSYLINSNFDSRGLIRIEPSAFNAQGFQESNALLEGKSKMISIPDLEILNNEVKCSHGSTISRIKDDDLFYFQSRGISLGEARLMMIKGHLLEFFQDVGVKDLAQKAFEGDL